MQNVSWEKGQWHLEVTFWKVVFQRGSKLLCSSMLKAKYYYATKSILWHSSRMQPASYREVAKFFTRASLFSPKQIFSHLPVRTSCWKCPFIWNAITMPLSLLNRPTLLFSTSILSPSLHSVSRIVPSSDSDTSQVPSLFCGCFPGNLPFFSPSFPGPLRKFLHVVCT